MTRPDQFAEFEALLEASSLGTPAARALRKRGRLLIAEAKAKCLMPDEFDKLIEQSPHSETAPVYPAALMLAPEHDTFAVDLQVFDDCSTAGSGQLASAENIGCCPGQLPTGPEWADIFARADDVLCELGWTRANGHVWVATWDVPEACGVALTFVVRRTR